ncbi:MAG: TetR family transcriptional regulator [Candidatus Eremiobacteraeota bacterium]|nr:TetR family transcriptional regulator [Candidatus Eremiobacteraeota bacterium]
MISRAATKPRRPPVSKTRRWSGTKLGGDEQRETTRLAILHAAAKMFVERGFYETSLTDIAASLGVTKPTLYYYVSSKDEMLAQIASEAIGATEKLISETSAGARDALDALRLFMRSYVRLMDGDFGRCLLAARHIRLAPETERRLNARFRRIDTRARELLASGVTDGSIRVTDVRMATFILYGAMNWVPHWYHDGGALTAEDAGDAMFAVLAEGFATRRPARARS